MSSYAKKIILGIFVLICSFLFSTILLGHFFHLELANYLTLIGFFGVLLGAFLALTQIRINYNFNRRKAAIDFIIKNIETENNPKLKMFMEEYPHLYADPGMETFIDVNTFYQTLLETDKGRAKIIRKLLLDIFNFYERMSIAILKETYDEDICYDDHGFIMTNFFQKTQSFIETLRTTYDEPRLYINFEHMSIRWFKRRERSKKQKLIDNQRI